MPPTIMRWFEPPQKSFEMVHRVSAFQGSQAQLNSRRAVWYKQMVIEKYKDSAQQRAATAAKGRQVKRKMDKFRIFSIKFRNCVQQM